MLFQKSERPCDSLLRLGEHHWNWEYAFRNVRPDLLSSSMLGVETSVIPNE